MRANGAQYRTVWLENGVVKMIDQPKLPHAFSIASLRTCEETAQAIRVMVVRGAGAIGAAAGFAMAQTALAAQTKSREEFGRSVEQAAALVRKTRPTAQNLFYAVERVLAATNGLEPEKAARAAVVEAQAIADEDASACQKIGEHGEALLEKKTRMLTHCNAGWLAFVDWGSALSPVYAAQRSGKAPFVWVDETRPRCQGAALTSWELGQEGVRHAIIADNAAGFFFSRGEVDIAIVGADRIAANGDVANKVGTYEKALLAREHGVPFYVAAPLSTIDFGCPDGGAIPIEERGEDEVLYASGLLDSGTQGRVRLAPKGASARNPAFDVTPAKLIAGIITPYGVVKPSRLRDAVPSRRQALSGPARTR